MIAGKRMVWCAAPVIAAALCVCASAGAAGTPPAPPVADRSALTAPLLFVKRMNYQGLHIYDTFYQWRPGGGIYVLENPADPPEQHRVRAVIDPTTPGTLGEGVYFDPSLSCDATRLLFSFKGSPTGHSSIYEIGVDGTGLRRVTDPGARAAAYHGRGGGHHDVTPCYLPDGRIVFTSTGQSGLVPCANNGVAILHVMNADGSNIHSISVNNVTDFNPAVLPDGRILFGRWEYIDRNALVIQSLWTILPDGRNETELYGNHMVFPEAILQAKPVPGHPGFVVATFAPHNAPPRGTIAMVDTRGGKNDTAAIFNFERPDRPIHDRGESCDPWALSKDLVVYSGRSPEPGAPPRNALMLIDRAGRRVTVHADPAIDLHHPIPLVPRPLPAVSLAVADRSQSAGRFFVQDVYAAMPGVKRGTVRWLRVVEETSRVSPSPGQNAMNQQFSISAALAWSAKIYHGVVPVEPDGSVFFEAPAGRALYFQLLDGDHRLVRGMRTFIQAAPGVTRSCTGCHEYNPAPANQTPRPAALRRLRPESWGDGHIDFTARVQPILDRNCVQCHGGAEGMAAGLDFSRSWTEYFNIAYEHLSARRERMYTADLIGGICAMNGTADWSCRVFGPYSHGSGNAPLADVLLTESHRDLLTRAERDQVFAWLDSNGVYFGTWDYTDAGPQSKPFLDTVARVKGVMVEAGCVQCHGDDKGAIRRFDQWINLDVPEMSRVLRAPLPASTDAAGGYGLALCRDRKVDSSFSRKGLLYGFGYAHAVLPLDTFPTQTWPAWPTDGEPVTPWASPEDPHYAKMLGIIREGRAAQLAAPRIDMPGAEWVGAGVREGRSRHLRPTPLPDPLPEVRAEVTAQGFVRLAWADSARTIGLTAEIHRSATPGFEPAETTRLGRTGRNAYLDTTPLAGAAEYAVIFMEGCDAAEDAPPRRAPARVAVIMPATAKRQQMRPSGRGA